MDGDLVLGLVLVVMSVVTLIVQKMPAWRRRRRIRNALRQVNQVLAAKRAETL